MGCSQSSDSDEETNSVAVPDQAELRSTSEDIKDAVGTTEGPALAPDQAARIEQNRLLALERRQQSQNNGSQQANDAEACQPMPANGFTAEQQALIESKRLAALERKRKLLESEDQPQNNVAEAGQHMDTSGHTGGETGGDASACGTASTAGIPPSKTIPKERSPKQALVAQLLCRWWYALPPWPPEDLDCEAALQARGMRCVAVEAFHTEPEVDECGRQRVFALANWQGLFRDSNGNLIDVRPVEGRPSYDQLMLKSKPELHRLLVTAFERQLEELEAQPGRENEKEAHLRELRRQVAETRRKASFAMMFAPKPGSREEAAKGE